MTHAKNRRPQSHWTVLALCLPLLYLQQLAPHHHAVPEAAADHPGHHEAAVPHHHTHDHSHGDTDAAQDDAHHHHTLAAHLDLHALPLAPTATEDGTTGTIAILASAPTPTTTGHEIRPRADGDPPPPRHASAPAAPRGPPHHA